MQTIEITREDRWVTIWLNRPDRRNALNATMIEELRTTAIKLSDDRTVRGVTLRGRGGVFCAGADLANLKDQSDAREAAVGSSRAVGELFDVFAHLPKYLIVYVEGAAIAGGLGLVCTADLVIGRPDATLALTEVRLGISPSQIAPHVISRVGVRGARQLMLAGARLDGSRALELGLFDTLVPDDAGLAAREAVVRADILKTAPGALADTKRLIAMSLRLSPEEYRRQAAEIFAEELLGDEGQEGIAAFLEKRAPSWRNEP